MIDGNNAMHAIPETSRELPRNRNQARDSLLRMLEPLVADGNRVTAVFDGKEGRGSLQKYRNMESFDVVYSSSSEGADGVIERMVMASKHPGKICVITNDNLIRNCAYEHGASAMRVEQFIKRLDHSIDQVSRRTSVLRQGTQKNSEPFHNKLEFPDLENGWMIPK